ncbi:threonine dehydratase [Variovorax dokdonensis]|uniref:Threonine dehydratase n=1 Tax=Variovorax dokdonensis TaxID=344883 RepID=A0ABT7NGN0_9BURK|nr:threonine dehydratase [Variovorax dokdonensis]MDM0047078.1 threonine dehydratase [Variovorax dokdonensis]
MRFTPEEIADAQANVYALMPPTPQYAWPLLSQRLGCRVWVKHENHTPTGAFKVRGGMTYMSSLRQQQPQVRHVISATRGNHGQSIGLAAARQGLSATIVVPHGNSVEKNAAMRALGVRLVEHGDDFQAAAEHARALADADGMHMIPSFARELVRGVCTYWIEFFEHVQRAGNVPDVVFVPLGMGSGFAAAAAARAHSRVDCRLVAVVSSHATAYLDSWRAGRVIQAPATTRLADGMACRAPDAEALAIVQQEADDVIAVSDDEVAQAMRMFYTDTHNLAEGAGAAALAAAWQQRERWQGRTVGVTLSGGNVDASLFAEVLSQS